MGEHSVKKRAVLLGTSVAVGAVIHVLGPPAGLTEFMPESVGGELDPETLARRAWTVLAIFAGVIASLMLRPYPMGPMVLLGVVLVTATQAATANDATAGYGKAVTWLVVAAFMIASGLVSTGLGRRIALMLVCRLGRTVLGLAYALSLADLLLAPVVPSNTARGGGILAPIFRSLATALGSEPDGDPERAGAYLAFTGAMSTVTTSAMFMTAMAANGLITVAAQDVMGVEFGWGTWALAMIVPGLAALLSMPLILHRIYPPRMKDASAAQSVARVDLEALGPWSAREKTMAAVFGMLILLWTTKGWHGISTGAVAWIGVLMLVLSGTVKYQEMLENTQTWDALLWLGGLLSMANLLKAQGTVAWFASVVEAQVGGLGPITAMIVLAVIYFYAMYGFSMLTAHIAAMAGAFLAVMLAVGAPPLVSVALLAAFSNVCACLTVYSTGPVIIYFGFRFVTASTWFRLGLLVSLVHMAIWLGVGLSWWKLLGWW